MLETVEYDYPQFHLTMHCYLCQLAKEKFVLKEHEAARWLGKNQLDEVAWLPADEGIVEKLVKSRQTMCRFCIVIMDQLKIIYLIDKKTYPQ